VASTAQTIEQIAAQLKAAQQALQTANEKQKETMPLRNRAQDLRRGLGPLKQKTDTEKALAVHLPKAATLLKQSQQADEAYAQIKDVFYRSQSGLLAADLIEGHPCPVCGSTTHPCPAPLPEHAVTREALERAEADKANAEKLLHEAGVATDRLRETLKGTLIQLDQLGMDPAGSYEAVEKEALDLERRAADLEKAHDDARKTQEDLRVLHEKAVSQKQGAEDRLKAAEIKQKELADTLFAGLAAQGFADLSAYRAAKMPTAAVEAFEKSIKEHDESKHFLNSRLGDLADVLQGKTPTDTAPAEEKLADAGAALEVAIQKENDARNSLKNNQSAAADLQKAKLEKDKNAGRWAVVADVYKTVSGRQTQREKFSFETYVGQFYFKQVITAANQRLNVLTDGMFTLRCKQEAKDKRSQAGLDLDVLDRATGLWRDASTLSGGESFMASLALALGMSDVVQSRSGQIRLDSMFIDEGFGTLDENALHQAVELLSRLADDGKRLVGVISHTPQLRERIDKKIVIQKHLNGSSLTIEA
jgi:exonuclease SbcC